MKTRTRSVTANKEGHDPQQLKSVDEQVTFPINEDKGNSSPLSPSILTSSNNAIPFFPQIDDQKPILSHLQPKEASDSDNNHTGSQEVEILSPENQSIAESNSFQNAYHEKEDGEYFDLMEASDMIAGM